jgi:hypothetical protein
MFPLCSVRTDDGHRYDVYPMTDDCLVIGRGQRTVSIPFERAIRSRHSWIRAAAIVSRGFGGIYNEMGELRR